MDGFAEVPEPGGDDGFVRLVVRVEAGGGEEVSGDVFGDELVVGDIGVEGADDVVAVVVGVVDRVVELVAVGFGVAHEVEPVPGPALAEVGGGEEAVDRIYDGGFRVKNLGFLKIFDFFERGGEAGEVEGEAPEEGEGVGWGSGFEFGFAEFCSDEFVDESGIERGGIEGFPAPVLGAAGFEIEGGEGGFGGGCGFVGPGGTVFDPGFEIGDHGIWEFAFRGHLHVGIPVVDQFDEEGFIGVAGGDGGARNRRL